MFSPAIAEYILLARKKKQLMQAKPKRKGRAHGASSLEIRWPQIFRLCKLGYKYSLFTDTCWQDVLLP